MNPTLVRVSRLTTSCQCATRWDRHKEEPLDYDIVDFHHFSSRLALVSLLSLLEDSARTYHAAVAAAPHEPDLAQKAVRSIVMVIGLGRNSEGGVGVLGPALTQALAGGTFTKVPLVITPVPHNAGRVLLPSSEVVRYILAQAEGDEPGVVAGMRMQAGGREGGQGGVELAPPSKGEEEDDLVRVPRPTNGASGDDATRTRCLQRGLGSSPPPPRRPSNEDGGARHHRQTSLSSR